MGGCRVDIGARGERRKGRDEAREHRGYTDQRPSTWARFAGRRACKRRQGGAQPRGACRLGPDLGASADSSGPFWKLSSLETRPYRILDSTARNEGPFSPRTRQSSSLEPTHLASTSHTATTRRQARSSSMRPPHLPQEQQKLRISSTDFTVTSSSHLLNLYLVAVA